MFQSLRQRFTWPPSPPVIAVTLSLVLVIWLLSGEKQGARDAPPGQQMKPEQKLSEVEVRWSEAAPLAREQLVQASITAWHQVDVRAQVAGRVEQLLKQQGDEVAAGAALLLLSDEGRTQRLAQMRADVRLRQKELEGGRTLSSDKLISQTELARLESELARAQAELAAAELVVEYNQPKAPFAGRVDRRAVEIGQLVQPGEVLMTVVDASRIRVGGQVPQVLASGIQAGQPAVVRLLDGRELNGQVNFISLAADPATRSFYVEVHASNPELWRVAGASATLRIQQAPVNAHRVSPALLTLNADGGLGIHVVNDEHTVVFHPVQIVSIEGDGAAVSGLPDRARIITQGAGFVRPGQQVEIREAAE
jgi:multidrug efflux system membrane fusion protein